MRGCTRKSSCAFLHRVRKAVGEEDTDKITNSTATDETIKELEKSITLMTSAIQQKNLEIENTKNYVVKLKTELEKKNIEIQEKDRIIKSLEDDSEYTDESEEERDCSYNNSDLIGNGYFGKQFEVRKGMEKEAEALRTEWRRNQKQK